MAVMMSATLYDNETLPFSWKVLVLNYWIIVLAIVFYFSCNTPVENDKNYYDDLTKGIENNLSENELGIINAMIEYKANGRSDEIAIITDSTWFYKFDTSRIVSKDTFPETLVNMLNGINDRRYYIGNSILNISFDYRYVDQTYVTDMDGQSADRGFWSEFYSRFPQSCTGIFSFSKIAINSDSTKAIALGIWSRGYKAADGGALSFRKENGKWKVIAYIIWFMS